MGSSRICAGSDNVVSCTRDSGRCRATERETSIPRSYNDGPSRVSRVYLALMKIQK
jgi:hypothetical protein